MITVYKALCNEITRMVKHTLPIASIALLAATAQVASAQTTQELGWVNFSYGSYAQSKGTLPKGGTTMWVASKGAFRTTFESVEDFTIYLDDNAFMGWAMSKPMYSWSANQYAPALRNYLISMTADSAAPLRNNNSVIYTPSAGPEFYKGHQYIGSSWTIMKDFNSGSGTYPKMPDQNDTAILSFAPSLAMVSITTAYPTFVTNGVDNTAWLYAHIDRILSHQNDIVLHTPSIVSTDDKRLRTASMSMHMLASVLWYQFRNDPKYLTFAKNAWDRIKTRQNTSGSPFNGTLVDFGTPNSTDNPPTNYSVLRHTQILAAMAQTFRVMGDYNGLNQALVNGSNALKKVNSPVSCTSWQISQGLYLGSTPCSADGNGGMGYPPAYREVTITDGFAYVGQLCHNAPQAQTAYQASLAAKRNSANSGYITGDFFNTFVGNRSITSGVFADTVPSDVVNDPLFIGGTLEGNAMTWLARWWQSQSTGC